MLLDEFDQIREQQAPHHSLNSHQWSVLRDHVIFFQRPLRPVDPGWCQFEEGEPRAARALPVARNSACSRRSTTSASGSASNLSGG